jgi:hypothetical protein
MNQESSIKIVLKSKNGFEVTIEGYGSIEFITATIAFAIEEFNLNSHAT